MQSSNNNTKWGQKSRQLKLRGWILAAFILGGISGYGTAVYLPLNSHIQAKLTPYLTRFQSPVSATSPTIQVRFAPGDNCTAFVVQAIQSAQKSILVQAYGFTCPTIIKALIDAHKRGLTVKILVDRSQLTGRGSKVKQVLAQGIPVAVDKVPGIAHNKVMIIDDAYVLTGSFNWSVAAEKRNAENLLLIKDATIQALYRENWEKRAMNAQALQNHH